MMFVHCPACATPVRQRRAFCTDCGATMPDPELVAINSTSYARRPQVRGRWLHAARVALLLRAP